MEQRNLAGYAVEIDREATGAWYAGAEEWGCECAGCRHFLALARTGMLPGPVMQMLKALDIPPEKATYVCRIVPDAQGGLYQFSYRIAGRILRKEEAQDTVDWVRCCHEVYPYGAPDFPEPHFDLEFWVALPEATQRK